MNFWSLSLLAGTPPEQSSFVWSARVRDRPTEILKASKNPHLRIEQSLLLCRMLVRNPSTPQNAPPDLDDDEGNHCNGGVESNRPSQIVSTNIEPLSTWNSSTSIFQQASAGASSSSESISKSIKLITGTESRDIYGLSISRYPSTRSGRGIQA